MEQVNINVFDLKSKYRNLYFNGVGKLHGTNDLWETRHNLTLLLGKNLEDFLTKTILDGSFERLEKDLPCVEGWKNLEQVFYILNGSTRYVVLRNFEKIPKTYHSSDGDIDILVENLQEFRSILVPNNNLSENFFMFSNVVKVANESIAFHAKFVGDDYYDEKMQQRIIETRILNGNNIYVPNDEMYFYSLLYHGIVHKVNYKKYSSSLVEKAKKLGLVDFRVDLEYLRKINSEWLIKNGYRYTLHLDSVSRIIHRENLLEGVTIDDTNGDVYYYYYHPCYGAVIFSKKSIAINPTLISMFIITKIDLNLPNLFSHRISEKSELYRLHSKKFKNGEIIWVYRILYGKILLTTYSLKKNSDILVFRKILNHSRKIKGAFLTISTGRNRFFIANGELVVDRFMRVRNDMGAIKREFDIFIGEVFRQFYFSNSHLKPAGWDALASNYIIDEDNKYKMFDTKFSMNIPIDISYMLWRICVHHPLAIDRFELYSYFCDKYKVPNKWDWCCHFDSMVHIGLYSDPKELDMFYSKITKSLALFFSFFIPIRTMRVKFREKLKVLFKKLFMYNDVRLFEKYFSEKNIF